ncbi:MAG: PilZ domain-containing protein [Oscillospiraceae bacterium]|nr:PilZ domain-containing protein [Oscillospiraceae bacterium]
MQLVFGGKIIKVDVLDEKGTLILSAEKGFVVPNNIAADEDGIIMIKGRGLPEFERNTIVSVVTTSKGGDRVRYMCTVTVSLDTQLNVKILRNNNTQLLEERRRFYKLKIKETGRALFYIRDEKTVRYDEPRGIEILDINVGGIFMVVDDEFLVDDLICVELDLFDEYPLNAAARVLRIQREPDGKISGYGCEFQGLTAAQEDYVSRFIYKIQSEMRQKEVAQEELL